MVCTLQLLRRGAERGCSVVCTLQLLRRSAERGCSVVCTLQLPRRGAERTDAWYARCSSPQGRRAD
ncbi:Protein of unknown function [Thermobacillus xylanilyticus]|uniref:Uncharacterized protein n=1 Tax=Thermobacillus xylanilyticus TaxID=76633 RepID=A0ABN7RZ49_THEXY|nr:Protein of unknown function [Thermobacillus xylanilyticus]